MLPITRSVQLLQRAAQALSQAYHPLRYALQLQRPFLEIGLVIQDFISYPGSTQRRRGVLGPNYHFYLTQDLSTGLFVGSDNVECAHSLTIESHILGVRLRNQQGEASICKQPYRSNILDEVSTGEPLICGIKKRNQLLPLHHLCNLEPVLEGRILSGGIVRTGMQYHDVSFLCLIEEVQQIINFDSFSDWVIVRVVAVV